MMEATKTPTVEATRETLNERLRYTHVKMSRDTAVSNCLAKIAKELVVRRDPKAEVGPYNRGEQDVAVVMGQTGSGKSHTIAYAIKKVPHPFNPEATLADCTVSVKMPSPFSTKELAQTLLRALGERDLHTDRLKDSALWGLVSQCLEKKGILVVHLDEFQRFKTERGLFGATHRRDAARRLAETVNFLTTHDIWPVALIVSGLPEILAFWNLKVLDQVKRRSRHVDLEQMTVGYEAMLKGLVDKYVGIAEIENTILPAFNLPARLRLAAGETVGIAIEMAQEAVILAVEGNSPLKPSHFAQVFAERHPEMVAKNPFVGEAWKQFRVASHSELADLYEGEIRNPKSARSARS